MDTFARTRAVTNTPLPFIQNPTSTVGKFWVFRNLGPSKIAINPHGPAGAMTQNKLSVGDYVEIYCLWATVELDSGETDPSILQWMPVA